MKFLGLFATVMAGMTTVGCSTETSKPKPGDNPDLQTNPDGTTPGLDHPPISEQVLPVASKGPRRISLHQLRRTIPKVFGTEADGTTPIAWKRGNADALTSLAGTLGEPDFIEVNEENLESSPMYLKMMDDMARDVCGRALLADAARTVQSDRVILRFAGEGSSAADVVKNLSYLKLRFHGEKVADAELAPLAELYNKTVADAAAETEPHVAGWRAVCVTLTLAPEFHLY